MLNPREQNSGFNSRAKNVIGMSLTILCVLIFLNTVQLNQLIHALSTFKWIYLFFAILALGAGYALRVLRWALILQSACNNVVMKGCIAPFLGSIALNNILPLRAGDVIRALIFPTSMGLTKTTALSSIIIERLIDLLTLTAFFALSLSAVTLINIPYELRLLAISIAGITLLCLIFVFLFSYSFAEIFQAKMQTAKTNSAYKVFSLLRDFSHNCTLMSRPRILLKILVLSALVWIAEGIFFYFILAGSGLLSSPLDGLLVMSVATLSTLIPSSPGYFGTFHLAALSAVLLIGGSESQAGSYAVIVHLALWLPTTLAGAIALWIHPTLLQPPKATFR